MSTDVCGSETPCAVYLAQNPFNITMDVIYNFDFDITIGKNEINFPQPIKVDRGQFVYLTQLDGQLAIDYSGNATFSDLVWNVTTKWTKLSEYSNWKFYFNARTNFTSYQNYFYLSHTYLNVGIYPLSIIFETSGQIISKIINVTDCMILILF